MNDVTLSGRDISTVVLALEEAAKERRYLARETRRLARNFRGASKEQRDATYRRAHEQMDRAREYAELADRLERESGPDLRAEAAHFAPVGWRG